jgi:hypothetical protein
LKIKKATKTRIGLCTGCGKDKIRVSKKTGICFFCKQDRRFKATLTFEAELLEALKLPTYASPNGIGNEDDVWDGI